MRHTLVAAVLLPALLSGCLSVSGRMTTANLGSIAETQNSRLGTSFSKQVLLTGYGVGADWLHTIGWQGVYLRGVTQSTDANGTPQRLDVRITDNEFTTGVPLNTMERFENLPVVLVPGLSMSLRETTVTGGAQATAISFRPRLSALVSVGRRTTLSADVGYNVPLFSNDPVGGSAKAPVKAGMPGPQGGLTLTVYLCPSCMAL